MTVCGATAAQPLDPIAFYMESQFEHIITQMVTVPASFQSLASVVETCKSLILKKKLKGCLHEWCWARVKGFDVGVGCAGSGTSLQIQRSGVGPLRTAWLPFKQRYCPFTPANSHSPWQKYT